MRLWRQEDGSVLVEVALVLPLLVIILIGAVDYSLLLQRQLRIQSAAAAGAAYLTLPSRTNDLAGAQHGALQTISDVEGAQASAQRYWTCSPGGTHVSSNSTCTSSRAAMQWVQVDVAASGAPLFRFPGLSPNDVLQKSATERVQWMP